MSDQLQLQTARGQINARLFPPTSPNSSLKLAVFSHPWAPLGGNMHDPVLQMLRGVFIENGFHVLAYNARTSFTGLGEVQDQQEIVQSVIRRLGGELEHLILLGYSHGSLIASMHPISPASVRTAHVLLAYPLSVRGLITFFKGAAYENGLRTLLQDPSCNVLILYGDQDQFTAVQKYDIWASELQKTSKGQLVISRIHGGDHFWANAAGQTMCEAVANWLSPQPKTAQHDPQPEWPHDNSSQ